MGDGVVLPAVVGDCSLSVVAVMVTLLFLLPSARLLAYVPWRHEDEDTTSLFPGENGQRVENWPQKSADENSKRTRVHASYWYGLDTRESKLVSAPHPAVTTHYRMNQIHQKLR